MDIDRKGGEQRIIDLITLGTLLNDLPTIEKQLMIDYYVLDLPGEEMKAKYATTASAIAKRIKRIVKKLQASQRIECGVVTRRRTRT